jgi:TolB-like protein/DNA-binding SARP family transcriptional activator/Flp pilus assembly protein TadD
VLTLKLFGTASIERSDGPATGRAAQGRRIALLALLALARGRAITRDKVIALLWPESGSDRARPQLSDTLYILRSALNEDVVHSAGDGLVLNPDAITSDVAMFEQLLDEGRFEAAVELYGGPLLDGFHLSGAAEFEHWLDAERARMAQRYAAALESLAEAAEADNRFAAAAGWWRRLAAHDPYSGRVALRLMRVLESAGDRAAAIQHARVHTALLREEFDAEPDSELTAFVAHLRHEPPARPVAERPAVRPAQPHMQSDPERPAAGHSPTPVKRPMRVYAQAAAGLLLVLSILAVYGVRQAGSSAAPAATRSVGVLPFVNMSPDPDNAYFSDGLSEQIIAALSRIEGLRVAARTSSFALRDGKLDARAIGDTLGVAAVLEGSVRKDGHRLRVTAQLIDAATGYHVWSDEYDVELADILSMQEQIATAIAAALELRLADNETAPDRRMPDLEAYDLYLRGLYLRNSLSADALRQAADFFDRAIELEPGFSLAYAAKASVIAPLIYFDHVAWEEGVREHRALVDRALELDPTLGEAYAALGILKLFFDWDWEGARQALARAIELNPNDPHAYHHLANYLHAMGRPGEAAAARERSVELDPLNARTLITLGNDYLVAGDFDRALASHRRALQLDPVIPLALGLGPNLPAGPAEVFRLQGRNDEAVEEYVKVATLRGASASELNALRSAYAASGMPGFWRNWLEMDLRQSASAPNSLRIAATWAMIGDTTRTFQWLDRAFDEHNPGLIYLRSHVSFETLRSHPRMVRIVSAMKFPDS